MPETVAFQIDVAAILTPGDGMVFRVGEPYNEGTAVKLIGLQTSSFPGFYTLMVVFDDDVSTTRRFLVSPSTVVFELGESVAKPSGLVVAQQAIPEDIAKR